MLNVFRKLAAALRTAAGPPARFAPRVEALHDRITPAAFTAGGHLLIYGSDLADTVTVARIGNNYVVTESDNRYVPGPSSNGPVKPAPTTTSIPVAVVTGDMVFKGYGRNDVFVNGTALKSTVYGGDGDDTLYGGSSRDKLYGEAGHDYLDGGSGSDELYGAAGHDTIRAGNDVSADANYLEGGTGDDTLIGSFGADTLYGQNGNDLMRAGDLDLGPNYLDGGYGDDTLYGGDGPDVLLGNAGADFLRGRGGDDHLEGGPQQDRLFGDAGNDYLNGGVGDEEADFLHGGAGRDTFVYDLTRDDPWWPWSYAPGYSLDSADDFNPADDFSVH